MWLKAGTAVTTYIDLYRVENNIDPLHYLIYGRVPVHTAEHSLTHVETLGSALGIISFLFQHNFFQFLFQFLPNKIWYRPVIALKMRTLKFSFRPSNFSIFHCGKLMKIRSNFDSVSPKRIKLDFWLRAFEILFLLSLYFLILTFTKLIKSTI